MQKWQNPETIAFWIGIVCTFIFVLAFLIVRLFRLKYKQTIETELGKIRAEIHFRQQLLDIQEKERVRFGADLHDNIIGKLIVVQLKNELSENKREITDLLATIIMDARRISHDLSPPMMEQIQLVQLIENTCSLAAEQFQIRFEQDLRFKAELPVRWKTHFVRMLQELMTNSLKHSGASELRIRLRVTPANICLQFSDNGKGFEPSQINQGIGMNTLSLRARELRAHYKLKSSPGEGVRFLLRYPITNL